MVASVSRACDSVTVTVKDPPSVTDAGVTAMPAVGSDVTRTPTEATLRLDG